MIATVYIERMLRYCDVFYIVVIFLLGTCFSLNYKWLSLSTGFEY